MLAVAKIVLAQYHPEHGKGLKATFFTLRPCVTKEKESQMEWQPIETAPKDGVTEFLAWGPGWHYPSSAAMDGSGEAYCPNSGYALETKPTHWMPLPEPPDA